MCSSTNTTIIARDEEGKEDAQMIPATTTSTRILNVAGDHMTGPQIARCFGKAQRTKCRHYNNRELTKMAKESFPDLYEQIHFLQNSKERTNIASLKKEFPGLITPFSEFLRETRWGDVDRTFDDLSKPETLEILEVHIVDKSKA